MDTDPASEDMQIRFRQSGGIVGGVWEVLVRMSELPPSEAQQLEALVEQADFFALPAPRSRSLPRRAMDVFEYDIAISQGQRRHRIRVDDTEVPAIVQPLINRLAELARRR